ncbi:hypothetical protein D3C72_2376750 [compost metagenome]
MEAGAAFDDACACASTDMGTCKPLSRSALPSTKTLESAIAAAAKIGESKVPLNGYSIPAATGINTAL